MTTCHQYTQSQQIVLDYIQKWLSPIGMNWDNLVGTTRLALHCPNSLGMLRPKVKPLITITIGIRGANYEQPIKDLERFKILETKIKSLMKQIHQIAIKYLTYLILNKRKLHNKQPPIDPP